MKHDAVLVHFCPVLAFARILKLKTELLRLGKLDEAIKIIKSINKVIKLVFFKSHIFLKLLSDITVLGNLFKDQFLGATFCPS